MRRFKPLAHRALPRRPVTGRRRVTVQGEAPRQGRRPGARHRALQPQRVGRWRATFRRRAAHGRGLARRPRRGRAVRRPLQALEAEDVAVKISPSSLKPLPGAVWSRNCVCSTWTGAWCPVVSSTIFARVPALPKAATWARRVKPHTERPPIWKNRCAHLSRLRPPLETTGGT